MAAASDIASGDLPGNSLIPGKSADFARPLVDATHTAYEKVAGGFEWYFEHWVDLYEEVSAEKAVGRGTFSVADILSALPDATVASDIPGRARLRLSQLKGQKETAGQIAEQIMALPGVSGVHVSAITGSILTFYDTDQYPSLDELLASVAG